MKRTMKNPLAHPRIKALWHNDRAATQGRADLFEPLDYGRLSHRYTAALSRTDSAGSLPSLCCDDGSSDSALSCTPPPPALESPPPTGCSTMAVLGSPSPIDSFEYERPEAHPHWLHRQLNANWHLRRQARMRDGDYRDTDNEEDFCVVDARIITNAPLLATRPLPDVCDAPAVFLPPPTTPENLGTDPRVSAWISKARSGVKHARRLSDRVKTPPPLNVSAIRAHILLAKLLRGSYEIEVGAIDGSESPDESGFEADDEDEDEDDSPEELRERRGPVRRAKVRPTSERAILAGVREHVGRPQGPPTKKSYAAVAASMGMTGTARGEVEKVGLSSMPVVRVREAKDWTIMFERRGPFSEA
ncbi:hypothetical protein OH77DRAFT_1525554 [Trametes cingulata]|nr:hypothetical protein OH77DRAFT_1525554 [Trametes cingulata]